MGTEQASKPVIKPNEKQQIAIDTLKGQVMMLAGPGTGKTFTVIHRIENMLKQGISPDRILCLTFSDAAATEMRQRLIKEMGVIATQVDIYTYHSFCNEIISNNPEKFNLKSGTSLTDATQRLNLMEKAIDIVEPKDFIPVRGNKYYYANDFAGYAEHLKTLRISKEEYLSNIETRPNLKPQLNEVESEIYLREKNGKKVTKKLLNEKANILKTIGKAIDVWNLYEKYSELMIENNLIDFADMICMVLDAFDDDELFKEQISNRYSYFLVDEYQDTNNLQNDIIFNLVDANEEKNLFVVGDDDQTIYGFQGANSLTIENFLEHYPDTKLICLTENNRSTQSILDFSYAIVARDYSRLEFNQKFAQKYEITKRLTAKNPKVTVLDKPVEKYHFHDTLQEFNTVVNKIEQIVNSPNCPKNKDDNEVKELSEIAIICKKREELRTFDEMLRARNIPCQIDEGKSIFKIRSTILTYFYLKVLCNQDLSKDKFYSLLLDEPFAIDLADYNTVLNNITYENNFLDVLRSKQNWKNPDKIKTFIDNYDYLVEYAQTNSLRNVIVEIINRTGILKAFFKHIPNKAENINGIKKLIEEANSFDKTGEGKSLNEFVQYLNDCIDNDFEINIDKGQKQNAIQLTTYHSSKGREFEYVFLPNLVNTSWEDYKNNREYKFITDEYLEEDQEQEKKKSELIKLLFVGITRAKHYLMVSFADENDGRPKQPTELLVNKVKEDEQLDHLEKMEDFTYVDSDEDDSFVQFFRSISREVTDHQKVFKDYIQSKINNVHLSPSRLNDYLSCPRKFFYNKILGINVEESNWDNANYGTIIHDLLYESATSAKTTGAYIPIEDIRRKFLAVTEKSKFSKPEIKENFIRLGNQAIDTYYPHFVEIPSTRLYAVEFPFDGVDVEGNFLTGKIDRIEVNKDGTYELFDYKTGSGTASNQIAIGKDKEGYFNQLCFYKYAFEKLTGKKVSKVGIIYVEINKTIDKILIESDMEYIENKIKEIFNNIKGMKFNPIKEDKNGPCKYCPYIHMCRLDLI